MSRNLEMTDAARRALHVAILRHNESGEPELELDGWQHYASRIDDDGVETLLFDREDGRAIGVELDAVHGALIDLPASIVSAPAPELELEPASEAPIVTPAQAEALRLAIVAAAEVAADASRRSWSAPNEAGQSEPRPADYGRIAEASDAVRDAVNNLLITAHVYGLSEAANAALGRGGDGDDEPPERTRTASDWTRYDDHGGGDEVAS